MSLPIIRRGDGNRDRRDDNWDDDPPPNDKNKRPPPTLPRFAPLPPLKPRKGKKELEKYQGI